MSEGTNMSKAEIEALVERLVSGRVAQIEIDFEHKLKFLETSFAERHEKLKQRVTKIRETLYREVLIDSNDVNDSCLESRISSLEEGKELAEFIKVDQENDKELEERLRSMDDRFDQLTFKLEISDSGGRIDTLESELSALEELVKEHLK
jgi:hypothetical protein